LYCGADDAWQEREGAYGTFALKSVARLSESIKRLKRMGFGAILAYRA
jgi:hypothetical protein